MPENSTFNFKGSRSAGLVRAASNCCFVGRNEFWIVMESISTLMVKATLRGLAPTVTADEDFVIGAEVEGVDQLRFASPAHPKGLARRRENPSSRRRQTDLPLLCGLQIASSATCPPARSRSPQQPQVSTSRSACPWRSRSWPAVRTPPAAPNSRASPALPRGGGQRTRRWDVPRFSDRHRAIGVMMHA